MDVAASVTANILTKLVDEAILQACYPFRFNKYVKELETEKENLQSKKQEVLDRAKDVRMNTHKVVGKVENWLDKADSLMAKVVELQEKTKKRNKMPCLKHCPSLISRYNLAKQLEEKTNEIREHNKVEFSEFSRLTSLVGMNYFSSQDFVAFDSRKGVCEDLLRAIKDDEIHMIGLYGMGGSGKTTLVKEVGKEAEKFFDKVVFVVVSNTIDVRKIQSEIASPLKLGLKEEETRVIARRLSMRLSSGERFLIILDDVWEKLNFEDIGIPTNNDQMGCTILITTRNLHLCKSMGCQKNIPLEGLKGNDSWALFKKHAGLSDDCFDKWKDIAKKITKKCDGLPIAIAAVASALKDKPFDDWVAAWKTLRDPSWIDIEDSLKSTYGCIRLSYDHLENEVAKSLFLFCSVYPEDYEILVDKLTIIGLGLGLAGDISSHWWARTQVINKAIKKLIDSCLLLKVDHEDGSHCIKMHDLVRDVALWMAKKETSKDMMKRAKTLSLRRIPRSWKNIIPDLCQTIGGSMNELTRLAIHDSDGIECVIGHATNISQVGIISNLTRLTLSKVKHLKTLHSGHPPHGLFANLEGLRIESCDSLEHILTEDVKEIVDGSEYQNYENAFPKLKGLEIGNCKQLKY
ncbi:probable disease resistance protein At4g27220 [Neltuma alba]|uniref:probable disease resistance protein At4g27220 n=1 Tax=Neltuma alba TaxID=207710 RepID=UPI0010A50149|nr:probable disease resistance protein At4g27220 [Prosopis alba]